MLLLILLISSTSQDSTVDYPVSNKNYTGQVLVNGVAAIGLGASALLFSSMGNKAYEDYRESNSIRDANDSYNKTLFYDNLRNVTAVGSALFLLRAIYYQLKSSRPDGSLGKRTLIDFDYAQHRCHLGIRRNL